MIARVNDDALNRIRQETGIPEEEWAGFIAKIHRQHEVAAEAGAIVKRAGEELRMSSGVESGLEIDQWLEDSITPLYETFSELNILPSKLLPSLPRERHDDMTNVCYDLLDAAMHRALGIPVASRPPKLRLIG